MRHMEKRISWFVLILLLGFLKKTTVFADTDSIFQARQQLEIQHLNSAEIGSMVQFGKYEQDGFPHNGPETISWIVLDKREGQILLLSRYGLEYAKYNDVNDNTLWDNCTLRSWLNNEFLKGSFTEEEKNLIALTEVEVEREPESLYVEDMVFLLSKDEFEKYFKDNYVKSNKNTYEVDEWWLRSPAGGYVKKGETTQIGLLALNLVRPAIWVNLVTYNETEGAYAYYNEKQIDGILEKAENSASKEDYYSALIELRDALIIYPKSERLLMRQKEYESIFADQTFAEIEKMITEEKYDFVADALSKAVWACPKNQQFKEKIQELSQQGLWNVDVLSGPRFFSAGFWCYINEKGEATIALCSENAKNSYILEIPYALKGLRVTGVGSSAFNGGSCIEEIRLPSGLQTVSDGAFSYCRALTTIDFPEGSSYFTVEEGCLIEKAEMKLVCYPPGLKEPEYVIPEGITAISGRAFANNVSLKSVSIPASVAEMGINPFGGCDNLNHIMVSQDSDGYGVIDDVLFDKNEGKLIAFPLGLTNSRYAVPDGTQKIGNSAFNGCETLQNITFPESLLEIEDLAFYNCKGLENISFAEGLMAIKNRAFSQCFSLKTLVFPGTLQLIESNAFTDCTNLENLIFTDGETSLILEDWCFESCRSIKSIELSNTVEEIGENSFPKVNTLTDISVSPLSEFYSSIDGVLFEKKSARLVLYPNGRPETVYAIPEGTRSIGGSAFSRSETLTEIVFPNSLETIEASAFSYCNRLVQLNFSEGLKNIDAFAFYECESLKDVSLPSSLENLEEEAFRDCVSLTRIELPAELTTYGEGALSGCGQLDEVTMPLYSEYYLIQDGALIDILSRKVVLYPPARTDTQYLVPEEVVLQEKNVFSDWLGVEFPGNRIPLEAIGSEAFYCCNQLQRVVISGSVKKIESDAFDSCENLTSVVIPSSVVTIETNAFIKCNELTLTVEKDSIGEQYAIENSIPYVYADALDWLNGGP